MFFVENNSVIRLVWCKFCDENKNPLQKIYLW